jgi:hypothetical protein
MGYRHPHAGKPPDADWAAQRSRSGRVPELQSPTEANSPVSLHHQVLLPGATPQNDRTAVLVGALSLTTSRDAKLLSEMPLMQLR